MEEEGERIVRGSSKREILIEESKPYILCIFANVLFSGFNIICKHSLDLGMSPYLLLVYGNAFGTVATALLAITFERSINQLNYIYLNRLCDG